MLGDVDLERARDLASKPVLGHFLAGDNAGCASFERGSNLSGGISDG